MKFPRQVGLLFLVVVFSLSLVSTGLAAEKTSTTSSAATSSQVKPGPPKTVPTKKAKKKRAPTKKKKKKKISSCQAVSPKPVAQTGEFGPRPSGIANGGSLQGLVENEIHYLRTGQHLRTGDQISLQVYDLVNKKMLADINGDTPRNAASLIKPFVMLAVYDAVARQELPENHEIEHLLHRMITVSDNPATNQLVRRLGNGDTTQGLVAINALMFKMGFYQTRVKELIPDGGKTYLNQTSANDATLFFRLLYDQRLINPHYSQKMNDILLKNVHDRIETFKIKQDGVAVADKTGYVRGLNADCGIVYQKTQNAGQDYVLSIFIENKTRPADGWGKRKSAVIRYLSDRIYNNLKNGQNNKS